MFRFPSWISESRGCDRVVDGGADIKMAHAMSPVMDILPDGVAKRKRSTNDYVMDMTDEGFHEPKRRKQSVANESEVGSTTDHSFDEKKDLVAITTDRVRETIEEQFSLEILLKHNELRLINQELAKCQVALEQLRRCSLIPYPTSQGTPESMCNISNGSGPALAQGKSVPQWAAPYGVTDGPYTRHYAKWLIPDPDFDGAQIEWNRAFDSSRAGKTVPEGRSTRNSIGDITPTGKARSHRGSTGQKLQALSSGYPQAKERAGPCILKRQDGQVVKLVCIDCQRENFSSTQGFINHCRIAHRRDFKSHEEAAVASGQPIEIDEVGGIVGDEKSSASATGLVHPLIRSAPTDREAYVALLSRIDASMALFKQGKLQGVTSIPTSANSTPLRSTMGVAPHRNFVGSLDTPHLSNLMRSKGLGINLTDMVGEAKEQVDFDELSSHEDDSEDGEKGPQRSLGGLDGAESSVPMRMPARAVMSPAVFGRPTSSKGLNSKNARKPGIPPRVAYVTPTISPVTAVPHNTPASRTINEHRVEVETPPDIDGDIHMMAPLFADLSPNTVASNNAPSLVSDDGEYDDGDDDAESSRSGDESEDNDVAEIDIEDGEVEKVVPRTVMRKRSESSGEAMRLRKEDKHVTFVSPVKEAKIKGRTRK